MITQQRLYKLPRAGTRPHVLLKTLARQPGTFYQICERAGINTDATVRAQFDDLVRRGFASLNGIVYTISTRASAALAAPGAPAAYCGEVAAPHFRGIVMPMPVRVVRRPSAREARA